MGRTMVVRHGFLVSRIAPYDAQTAMETHPPFWEPSEPDLLLLRHDALSQSP